MPTGCLIVSGDDGTSDAAVKTPLRRIRRQKTDHLADKIRADVAAERLPADTDPQALAQYVMTTLNAIAQAASDRVPRTMLDRVAAIALRAWPPRP